MGARDVWSRILVIGGGLAMVVGAVDPLEGSIVIVGGSGLVTLGTFVGRAGRGMMRYWLITWGMIVAGVAAMFVLSAFGGIGGKTGHSMWWGLVILPYPIGWVMGMGSLAMRGVWRVRGGRRVAA